MYNLTNSTFLEVFNTTCLKKLVSIKNIDNMIFRI